MYVGDEGDTFNRITNSTIRYVYNTFTSEKKKYSAKPPSFTGDATQFSWWMSKIYSHIIGVDDEM